MQRLAIIMTMSNANVANVRYCITCEQSIRPGLITCVDCEKILDIIAASPVPSFHDNTTPKNSNTEPPSRASQDVCCMCAIPTILGSQFCSECECSMAMVLEDPVYAFDEDTVPAPPNATKAREVTQDMQRDTNEEEEDSDEEIEVVAELTETELMMQRFEEAKQNGDLVELLDDDDDEDIEPSSSKTATYKSDDEIQFIKTTCSAVI